MKKIKVGQLGKIVTGNTPPRNQPDLYGKAVLFIKPTDISKTSKYTYFPEECYSEKGANKYSASLIPKGSTCVVTIGSIGKKMTMAHSECFINQAMNAIIPNEDYDNEYVYYLLKDNLSKLKSIDSGTSSGRENVSKSAFSNMELHVIESKDSQKRIGQILSSYDYLILNNQRQIMLLEEAAIRLYKEWFINLKFPGCEKANIDNGLPEGWRRKKLIEIADIQYGFAFDSRKFNNLKKGTPIIRIRNIPSGNTSDCTTESADEQYLVKNGDIVVGMDGEFHINTWSGETAYLVQRTCRIKPKNRLMDGYILQSIYEPIKFFEKTVVGATVAHLGKKHIDTITVLEPPEELYLPFQYMLQRRQLILNQNILLGQARDKILPRLMAGEIEV